MSMHKNKNEHLTLEEEVGGVWGAGLRRKEHKKKADTLWELWNDEDKPWYFLFLYIYLYFFFLPQRLHSVDDRRVVRPRWHTWLLMSACTALIKSSGLRQGHWGNLAWGAKGISDTAGNQQAEVWLMSAAHQERINRRTLAAVASHHATCWRKCGTEGQVAVWEVQVGLMVIFDQKKKYPLFVACGYRIYIVSSENKLGLCNTQHSDIMLGAKYFLVVFWSWILFSQLTEQNRKSYNRRTCYESCFRPQSSCEPF